MNRLILINGKGEEYDLLAVSKSPTFQVGGMGYEDATEFLQIGDNYYPLEEMTEQAELEMHLLFWNNADVTYKNFMRHVRHNPLTLLYENGTGTYYVPCRLRMIEKVDRRYYDKYGCPVTFLVTGRPYRIVSEEQTGSVTEGKNYGASGYTYDYTYGSDAVNTIILYSDSVTKSPCTLTIYGAVENPIWRHYVDDELVETGAYEGIISEGNYLVIDARTIPYSVIEYDQSGNVVADRYVQCDFSTERFMHINEGVNRYVLSHATEDSLRMKVEAYIRYDSV